MRSVAALLLLIFSIHIAAFAQSAPPDDPSDDSDPNAQGVDPGAADGGAGNTLYENIGKLAKGFNALGNWKQHQAYILDATEKVYARNGWDSEPDRFSLELIREVNSHPPLAIQERFDTLSGMISDRYMLNPDQEANFRKIVMQESLNMFAKHSGEIMSYSMEALQTRAAGEAFTPEQVQRWTKQAEPIFMEARERVNTLGKEFLEQLDPQQRELVQRDLDAANHRLDGMERMGKEWMDGKWSPADWGMEDDPIQVAGEQLAAERAAAGEAGQVGGKSGEKGGAASQPTVKLGGAEFQPTNGQPTPQPNGGGAAPANPQPAPQNPQTGPRPAGDPSLEPWARYVQAFITKYSLNQEQSLRCWVIYDEVKPRAAKIQNQPVNASPVPDDTKVRSDGAKIAARDNELARLFQQMSRRLERIPTTAQRRNAPPGDLPTPVALSKEASPTKGSTSDSRQRKTAVAGATTKTATSKPSK